VSNLERLYQEAILDHDKAPRHAVAVPLPTHRADANNPLCGDRVALTVRVLDGRIADVGCEVKGCAICRASGSMLAERISGRELSEVLGFSQRFLGAFGSAAAGDSGSGDGVSEAGSSEGWGPLAALLKARRYPNRQRCATLPWEALARALGVQGSVGMPDSSP
jgi:nitrogen fixation NifU-like protein